MTKPIGSTDLLAHAGWVRSLAKSLAEDPHVADEIAQETWVAALESGPRDLGSLRAWLAAVARNFALQLRRGDERRARREDRSRRADESASTVDVVARAEHQRELVEAVLALEEPYRTTVLLRFFDGLAPRAIAERQGISVATVRTRLARGLNNLRRRLERRYGDRRAWLAVLLPLAERPLGFPTSTLGALLVKTKIQLALATAALAGAGYLAIRTIESPPALAPGERADEPTADTLRADSEERAEPPAAPEIQREVLSRVTAKETEPTAPIGEQPLRLRGRVLDAEGLPLSGVALTFIAHGDYPSDSAAGASSPAQFQSGTSGFFEIEAPREAGVFVAAGSERATVLGGRFQPGPSDPEAVVVVVSSRAPLAGRVTDEAGAPVAGAAIEWLLPDGFRARFEDVLDRSSPARVTTASDALGSFALPAAPSVRDARLSAHAEGFEPWLEPAPEQADLALAIVLRRPSSGARAVRGLVIDRASDPVEGARVALGLTTMQTDARGRFEFDLDDRSEIDRMLGVPADRLVAVKRGHLPAVLEAPRGADGEPVWPDEVVLRLGSEPLAIAGRVLHKDGSPAPGIAAWVADPTLFGEIDRGPALLEGYLAGARNTWHRVTTDAEGRFRIEGLLERTYRVEVMDPTTLLRVGLDGVQAGSETLEIELPEDELIPRVAGRIVSGRGTPIANAVIGPQCDAFRLQYEGQTFSTYHESVEGVRTDEEGRFELLRVPKSLVYLRVDAEDTLPVEYGRSHPGGIQELAGGRMTELEIVVPLRCHLKVVLAPGDAADRIAILDADGARLMLNVIQANSRHETEVLALSEGGSPPLAVSDTAAMLVLLRGEEELDRIPLELVPGELNVVQL